MRDLRRYAETHRAHESGNGMRRTHSTNAPVEFHPANRHQLETMFEMFRGRNIRPWCRDGVWYWPAQKEQPA